MIHQTTTRTIHPQRTSEANAVPLAWAIAEMTRLQGPLTPDQRRDAVLVGWAGVRVEYPHTLSPAEYADALRQHLANVVREALADGHVTRDEMAAMVAAAENRPVGG